MASFGKTGVLIVNLGTPDSPSHYDVYRYLREFLTDRRVIDVPWIPRQALVQGVIAPFRSGGSAKLYQDLWTPEIPELVLIRDYYDNPAMIGCYVKNAREFDIPSYDHVLFSFHGLPESQLVKADRHHHCAKKENCCHSIGKHNQYCYSAQCHNTAQLIAAELGLTSEDYSVCFQSRLGPAKWAQPYTSEVIKQRREKGDTKLLVLCPAFTADCLETTIEISDEYWEEFEEMGGEKLDLVPSLNDMPEWVEAVAAIIREKAGMKERVLA